MALSTRRYGDPLVVLLRAEEATCKGCVHEKKQRVQGTGGIWLIRGTCKLPKHVHGQRCAEYQERSL